MKQSIPRGLRVGRIILLGVSVLFVLLSGTVYADGEVRSVVFLIGDGMGISQVAAARIKTHGAGGRLNMEKLPVTGLMDTHPAAGLVTDSASAGTALATGCKTNNRMVSMNPDGKKLRTILESCRDSGMATGLVVTCALTHATPAVFAAHVKSRYDQPAIAGQLLESGVTVMLGGGEGFFLPRSRPGSKRSDERNLMAEFRKRGYAVVRTREELLNVPGDRVLGLFHAGHLTTRSPEPSLAEMTRKAIELLSRGGKGFFLMVEGSQIDFACHANNADETIRQTVLFDKAVGAAVAFARENGQTLVIVTADHETGGMGINGGSPDGGNVSIGWTSGGHTAVPVPIYAFGPGAERFTGLHDNTDIPRIFADLLGMKSFGERDR